MRDDTLTKAACHVQYRLSDSLKNVHLLPCQSIWTLGVFIAAVFQRNGSETAHSYSHESPDTASSSTLPFVCMFAADGAR